MLKVKLLTQDGKLPTKAYDNEDAGYDLYVSRYSVINPGETVDVSTSIAIELPFGYYGRLVGRSSTLRKRGLIVNEGIIDNGYRGELFICLHNVNNEQVTVHPGERIAQLIVHRIDSLGWEVEEVTQLSQSERGKKGFGSSGL